MSNTENVQYSKQIESSQIALTEPAREKMAELLANADDDVDAVRIFVSGGGCGGMTYGMTFSDRTTEYDSVLEGSGIRVLVDPVALNYLHGCEVDFKSEGANQSFVFNNVFQAVGGSGACGGCGGASGDGGCGV
ncbi:MAG TPA: iron-sulfur cluster assembly accessory protein [Acidiferrobacteraceae bacterium]|nr:iron-sulfur cluster assembly accessory protein [Acidiferrobacteraceae bacterium]